MEAVRNRGYRLSVLGEALVAKRIRESTARNIRDRLVRLDVAWSISSTK